MDLDSIGTGLSILGASQVTKDAVARILAPTADYVGSGVLTSAKAATNLARILTAGTRKMTKDFDPHGQLPARVLRAVLDEGPFCDDEISAEYFGGILAASWGDGRDDRGVTLLNLLGRLSTYAIRTHYLCYSMFDKLLRSTRSLTGEISVLYLSASDYMDFMEFDERDDSWEILAHSVTILTRENLLTFQITGSAGFLKTQDLSGYRDDVQEKMRQSGAIVFEPNAAGVELYMWAHGIKRAFIEDEFDERFDALFAPIEGVGVIPAAIPL